MKRDTSQRLKQIMEERDLRQVDILEMSKPYQEKFNVKLGKSALSQYISGKTVPDQDKLVLLSKTLGVSEAWLMGYDATNVANVYGNNTGINTTGDINGNVSFGSSIQKEDLHEVASDLNLTDRELQEKTLNEVSDLRASQARLENVIALLIENQAEVLENMKSVDDTFKEIMNRLTKVER